MSDKLEKIDLLRQRANVSYEEAKEALEKFNYDLVEALIYLEKQNKIKTSKINCKGSKFVEYTKELIRKGDKTRFIIKKSDTTVLNIPVTVAAIATVAAMPFAIAGIALALITDHKIKFEKADGEDIKINKVFDKISKEVHDMTDKMREKSAEAK
jgi:NACalpha-BTF3-like transcription factor